MLSVEFFCLVGPHDLHIVSWDKFPTFYVFVMYYAAWSHKISLSKNKVLGSFYLFAPQLIPFDLLTVTSISSPHSLLSSLFYCFCCEMPNRPTMLVTINMPKIHCFQSWVPSLSLNVLTSPHGYGNWILQSENQMDGTPNLPAKVEFSSRSASLTMVVFVLPHKWEPLKPLLRLSSPLFPHISLITFTTTMVS